jgi:hypothetical protein
VQRFVWHRRVNNLTSLVAFDEQQQHRCQQKQQAAANRYEPPDRMTVRQPLTPGFRVLVRSASIEDQRQDSNEKKENSD